MRTRLLRYRMLLAALLLTVSSTSCFTLAALDDELDLPAAVVPMAIALDVVTFPIQLAVIAELAEDDDDACSE